MGASARVMPANARLLTPALVGLACLAWLTLYVWSASPYARFLGHDALTTLSIAQLGDYLPVLLLFVAGWTLMTVAMMLPTTLPLVTLFARLVRHHANQRTLITLLLLGYVGVWLGFGLLAYAGDWLLHLAVARSLWLALHPWVIAAVIFLLVGIYQFTPLKYYCLEQCRSPLSFILARWHGRQPQHEALTLGIRHGLFCLGCCWLLMLLMFAVGMGNLGWMLALAIVMAVEKNLPWGRRISAPLGMALISWALLLLMVPAWR